ncbi:putative Histone-lysine N-methyltransferase SET9 [Apiospora marii]|uniref:Histone-lysine N-methyltransferase SET9 n=1 Tax=Apiospora marii TaxID=335849 RepID=A0ABR1R3N2_9PEZI
MAPSAAAAAKKQSITLKQVQEYDDILTDALVDHVYYWTTIPKNKAKYHPSRGVKEEEIAKIIQDHLIVEPDMDVAEAKLLATAGLRKFHNGLKTEKEKDAFRKHLRRYMQIYLPDSPFEVSTTNRYTIVTHEAAVTARRYIRRGQPVKYLSGIQVLMSAEEEEDISRRKKDFSIVVSSRNKCASLFMGPARFANHDCDANAQLKIISQSSIEIHATRDIDVGEEITVVYGDNYFGEDNCECLCQSCETRLVNGWTQPDGAAPVQRSVEEEALSEGYGLRQRRGRSSARSSRTPSITPDIRPKVRKSSSRSLLRTNSGASTSDSPAPETLLRQKRKREYESLKTPPVTPAKKPKLMDFEPVPVPASLSRRSSVAESTGSDHVSGATSDSDSIGTDVTVPDDAKEVKATLQSPNLTPTRTAMPSLKLEDSDVSTFSNVVVSLEPAESDVAQETVYAAPTAGIVADSVPPSSSNPDDCEMVDMIVIPPPLTPASKPVEQLPSTPPSATNAAQSAPAKRGRGRPRGSGTKAKSVPSSPESLPSSQTQEVKVEVPPQLEANLIEETETPAADTNTHRVPGDYTLTPKLLHGNSAWISCTICSSAFVQQNATYTLISCPRCERHSKLYGYEWPKTEKEGKHDKEERILDHREICRFLHPEDEAKIRGRKYPVSAKRQSEMAEMSAKKARSPATPGQKRRQSAGDPFDSELKDDGEVRRSGRRRQLTSKVVEE